MTSVSEDAEAVEKLLETPDLATALESEQFKKFLDQVPIAIAVSDLTVSERVVYANPEFEKLSGREAASLTRENWGALVGTGLRHQKDRSLAQAVVEEIDFVGTFRLERASEKPPLVDVYSNLIEDDNGKICFRLVALVDVTAHGEADDRSAELRVHEKDTLLRELQHRVKNNLQMITALIRMETRNATVSDQKHFERLAGRVDALAILYQTLAAEEQKDEVDLGVYLSQIASAVMASHAVEGIRLDMKVDTYPVSIDVAMPTGLVVNELLTNSLKHAFPGRDGGTITLHSIVNGDGCRVVIADNGVGLPEGETWPKPGKLGALIARSLTENAKAQFDVRSTPSEGTKVTIAFKRSAAAS